MASTGIDPLLRAQSFRRAAAFLLHWLDPQERGEGCAEILREIDVCDENMTGFVCAMARLSWQMVKGADARGAEGAAAYVRSVAAEAAADEVRAADA